MKILTHWLHKCMPAGFLLLFSGSASAARLVVEAEAPMFLHVGAAILLYAHIGGGAIGIMSGFVAGLSRKGHRIHRLAGKTFFISMFICYLLAALVAPFLDTEQRTNFVAAILALYLLLTGVFTARRKIFVAGIAEKIGLVFALLITAMGLSFMAMSNQNPSGTVDGAPPNAFILFVVVGAVAAAGELNAILRKTLSPASRIVRHLWRVCLSLFIASGSLFFGQAAFFPDWFNGSILPMVFGLFPFVVLFIGVLKYKNPYAFAVRKFASIR